LFKPVAVLAAFFAISSSMLLAQSKPAPDVLIFTNGDQLTGKLERAAGGSVVFASDMAGELTIPFDKIKELRSGAQFALLRKGVPVTKKSAPLPEGTVAVDAGKVIVAAPEVAPVSEPVGDVAYLIAKPDFDKQIGRKAGFKEGWNGTLTGGATLVRSTTSATTLTAGVALVRTLPTVAWLPPRNRTTIDVVETYGKSSSPVIPPTVPATPATVVLSSIFHADAERDQYFSPKLYALGDTAFDHNYAQGLQLQQIYGGGVGWTPVKSDKQQLDVKADVHYEKQQYIATAGVVTTPSVNLIGATVFEAYRRNLPRKIVFTETANILPSFNLARAYSANATASLALPVFKRLSAVFTTTDNFLNDPAEYYKKNSYQFVTGVTYTLK
jgi:hypothetical protein